MTDEERFRQISLLAGKLVESLEALETTLMKEHAVHADFNETIRRLWYIEGLCGVLEEEEK